MTANIARSSYKKRALGSIEPGSVAADALVSDAPTIIIASGGPDGTQPEAIRKRSPLIASTWITQSRER